MIDETKFREIFSEEISNKDKALNRAKTVHFKTVARNYLVEFNLDSL